MFIGTPQGAYIYIIGIYLQVGIQGIPRNIVGIYSPEIQPRVQLTQTLGIFWLPYIQYIGLPPWHTHRVYPEKNYVVPMGKYEGCGATPYYLRKPLVLFWGLQGVKPHAKIKNFYYYKLVNAQKHQGDLWFLYLETPC